MQPFGTQRWSMLGLVGAMVFLLTPVALANHPFHISTAQVEYNAKSKRLEVALKCQSIDLERALGRLVSQKLDIEKDTRVDDLLVQYLTDNFYLAAPVPVTKDKSASTDVAVEVPAPPDEKILLVGKEFEIKWVWVYFELQPPAGEEPLVLVNRVLFEINTGQINTCLIRLHGQRQALKSTSSKPSQEFKREWLVAPPTQPTQP